MNYRKLGMYHNNFTFLSKLKVKFDYLFFKLKIEKLSTYSMKLISQELKNSLWTKNKTKTLLNYFIKIIRGDFNYGQKPNTFEILYQDY